MSLGPFEIPPTPKPGDQLRVIAPSGPFDRTLFFRGLAFLSQTFRVQWNRTVFHREGFLAGSRSERAFELQSALTCPESRLVVCARGGVGSADLFDTLLSFSGPPKWLVGFSDITALHAGLQRRGWMSIHGPTVTSLGRGNALLRERCIAHFLDPLRSRTVALSPLFPGQASGPLVGGNLAVLHDLCAANAWHPPPGAILFVEEIAEPPYRIYRMLSAMRRGGHLANVAALVVGQVTLSSPGHHRTTAREVITALCQEWSLPAAWGIQSGHDPRVNDPLTLGAEAELNVTATAACVTFNPTR